MAFLLLAMAYATSAIAQSQPSASEDLPLAIPPVDRTRWVEAQTRFNRGLLLATVDRDWSGALNEFLASRKLFATRSATRNAGIALRELGRHAEALEMYEALEQEFSNSTPPKQLAATRAEEAALRQRVGHVELRNTIEGTAVSIDGKSYGTVPLTRRLWLDSGVHMLRLSKDGFEIAEHQIRITPGASTEVSARLRALEGKGILAVREVNGEPLDVVVDGANMGSAPWRGALSVGRHSVLLRGSGRGTLPVAVQVSLLRVTNVQLKSIPLDSGVVIVPTPESATLFVDGTFVGSGAWHGLLPGGLHRIEALAPGYQAFAAEVRIGKGEKKTIQATMAKIGPSPPSKPIGLYVEAAAGGVFANSFGGALADCECTRHSGPHGWLASVTAGLVLKKPFAVELSGGFISMAESAVRRMQVPGEKHDEGASGPFSSEDYEDTVRLRGPYATVGTSARSGSPIFVTSRISVGIARLTQETSNVGTFAGPVYIETPPEEISGRLSAYEVPIAQWAFLAKAELRVGYRVTRFFTLDLGAAIKVIALPQTVREHRYLGFSQEEPYAQRAGVLSLPHEVAVSTFISLAPLVGGRFEF